MIKHYPNSTYSILSNLHNIKLKLLLEGILVGSAAGFLVVFYRLTLEQAEKMRIYILSTHISLIKLIPIYFLGLIILGIVVGHLIKTEPMISGSGIPQVEAVLLDKLHMNWLPVIIKKFIGGTLSIGAGLSLGREGPSIQLGAAVGQGIGHIFKRSKAEEKYLITSGASAGLAAAFNAPLAGVMFSLEEVHKHFSPLILLSAMSASVTADFISKHFFGLKPVFNFQHIVPLPLNSYGYILILGLILGVWGVIYNSILAKTQLLYSNLSFLPTQFKPLIPFILAGFLAIVFPEILGSGHTIMDLLIDGSLPLKIIILILLGKFIFSMISFGSGAPGGIFFPLLVIGAFTGSIYGNVIIKFFGLNKEYLNNFVILAMAGYFAAIVRSPITGTILIAEMTGSFSHILSLSFISVTAYVTADLLKSTPVYEYLLGRLLMNNADNDYSTVSKNKILLEIPVCLNCKLDHKLIREIKIPAECLLVSVRRGNNELIPNGNTRIYSGDFLLVLVNQSEADAVNDKLSAVTSPIS